MREYSLLKRLLRGSSPINAELYAGQHPPDPARLLELAAGLVEMTSAEREWLMAHPKLVKALRSFQTAVIEFEAGTSPTRSDASDLLAADAHHDKG